MKKLKFIVLGLLLVSITAIGQNAENADPMKNGTLKEQFEYVIKKSSTYEEFKVVKLRSLNQLKTNSMDSVGQLNKELVHAASQIEAGQSSIDSLNNVVEGVREQYADALKSKNSFNFIGIQIGKTLYNTIMWSLVIGMLVLSIIVFMAFKRGHYVTKETKVRLSEVEEEFENHRKTALRREQKLARELMDERMKGKL